MGCGQQKQPINRQSHENIAQYQSQNGRLITIENKQEKDNKTQTINIRIQPQPKKRHESVPQKQNFLQNFQIIDSLCQLATNKMNEQSYSIHDLQGYQSSLNDFYVELLSKVENFSGTKEDSYLSIKLISKMEQIYQVQEKIEAKIKILQADQQIQEIEEQQQKLQKSVVDPDLDICIICLDKKRQYANIPCGHFKFCEDCIKYEEQKGECSQCKQKVVSITKIYE